MLREITKSICLLSHSQRLIFLLIIFIKVLFISLDIIGLILVGYVAAIFAGLNTPGLDKLIAFVSNLSGSGVTNSYAILLALTVFFFISKSVFSYLTNRYLSGFLAKIEYRLATKMFAEFMTAPLSDSEKVSVSELLQTLNYSVHAAISLSLNTFSVIVGEVFLVASISIYLALINLELFFAMAAVFGFLGWVISALLLKRSAIASQKVHQASLRSNSLLIAGSENIRLLMTSGKWTNFLEGFQKERADLAVQTARYTTITTLPRFLTEILILLGIAVLVMQRSFNANTIDAPTIAVYLGGIFRIVAALLPLQTSISTFKKVSVDSLLAFQFHSKFGVKQENFGREGSKFLNQEKDIELNNLNFKYPGSNKLLFRNVNIKVPFGTFLLVEGRSGAGKSTFADIVSGLRLPTSGEVFISGMPARDFVKSNPGVISYVSQDAKIFSGTLLQNITLNLNGEPFDEDLLKKSMDESALNELVAELPSGLGTSIGPGNIQLSGGQKQRIGLARAIYAGSEILILDEVTSALDKSTEGILVKHLRDNLGSKTIICISHTEAMKTLATLTLNISEL